MCETSVITDYTNQTKSKRKRLTSQAHRAAILNRPAPPLPPLLFSSLLFSSLCSPPNAAQPHPPPRNSNQAAVQGSGGEGGPRQATALVGRQGGRRPLHPQTHSPTNRRTNKHTNNLLALRWSTDAWSPAALRSGAPPALWLRRVLQIENQDQAQDRPCLLHPPCHCSLGDLGDASPRRTPQHGLADTATTATISQSPLELSIYSQHAHFCGGHV